MSKLVLIEELQILWVFPVAYTSSQIFENVRKKFAAIWLEKGQKAGFFAS